MNPRSVNSPLPAWTYRDDPSVVRIKPYTSHGWRPISAVSHPAVFAMYGNGTASIKVQSIQRLSSRRPRHSSTAAAAITNTNTVPRPAMMW